VRDFGGEEPLVLVANDIAPADMLQFKRSVFTGFVTDVGGAPRTRPSWRAAWTSPPWWVRARPAGLVRQDDWLIIDGDAGVVIVNPSPIVLEEYRFRQRQSELERAAWTVCGTRRRSRWTASPSNCWPTSNCPGDAPGALEAGAVGVGLFRSEFLFMNRDGELPDEDEQFEAYRAAVLAMAGLPVTIRTVDIGADKPLDRMSRA
jgi:phosphotransferase system enzyme I (PtsI)